MRENKTGDLSGPGLVTILRPAKPVSEQRRKKMSNKATHTPPEVPFYFQDHKQWDNINQLGMWLFLATEVLFFGALFVGFILLKEKFPEAFEAGPQ